MSTIYFLNGDTLQVVVEEKNEWNITIIKSQKKDKTKHKIINNDQILMITNDKGEKDFVYKHDPSKGNFMEKIEMEQYVKGRIKAKYFYTLDKDSEPLFVSKEYAHGYLTLEPNTIFTYGVVGEYKPQSEHSIVWDSITQLKEVIMSHVKVKNLLTISEKDKVGK